MLVVEDTFGVAGEVRYALNSASTVDVEAVGTQQGAWDIISNHLPDLIVLSVSSPRESQLEFCRQLRVGPDAATVPIIVTSASFSEAGKILALDLGADDCICRPFAPQEFAARARSLVRRQPMQGSPRTMHYSQRLVADFARVAISVDGKPVRLTRREFLMLELLVINRSRVLSREQLIERLWPANRHVNNRTIDVHIGRLRAKLGSAGGQIETVFGIGYRFVEGHS